MVDFGEVQTEQNGSRDSCSGKSGIQCYRQQCCIQDEDNTGDQCIVGAVPNIFIVCLMIMLGYTVACRYGTGILELLKMQRSG